MKINFFMALLLLGAGSTSILGAFITWQGAILYNQQIQSPEVTAYYHNCAVNGYFCNPLFTAEWGIFVIALGLALMICIPLTAVALIYKPTAIRD